MRILISTSLFYPSNLGGPANTLYWLAKGLVVSGINVTVITTDECIDKGRVQPDEWINIDGITTKYCSFTGYSTLKMLLNTMQVVGKCDWVMLSDLFQRQILFTAIIARLWNKRIIWSPRGELFPSALGKSISKRLYLSIVRLFFSRSSVFHATSEEEKELIIRYFGYKVQVVTIPNYMELPSIKERSSITPPYFLFLGRIAPIKALDRLIEAMALSKKFRNSDYVFRLAGGVESQFQDYKLKLDSLVRKHNLQNKVLFVGPIKGEQKYQDLSNASALFLVSHSENFGNVVIEALSQGTPVVASSGTPWQALVDFEAGYWIDNSPESIADCIDRLISIEVSNYNIMRSNAIKLGHSYDIHSNINKWVGVLNPIGGTHKNDRTYE